MKNLFRSYLESVMSLGYYGTFCLVKYCFILEKNANYGTPLKMPTRQAIFGFTLVIVCGKLKRKQEVKDGLVQDVKFGVYVTFIENTEQGVSFVL